MKDLNSLHYGGYMEAPVKRGNIRDMSKSFYGVEEPGQRTLAKSVIPFGEVNAVDVLDFHMRKASQKMDMEKKQKERQKRGMGGLQ